MADKGSPGATLLKRFTIASLAATLIVGALFGAVAARVVEEYAYRERAYTMAFYVSEFLAPRLTAQDFAPAAGSRKAALESALRDLVGRAGIQRIAVWTSQGQVLYGDGPGVVGRRSAISTYLRLALDGRIAWRRGATDTRTSNPEDGLEVFIPVVAPGAAHPVAAYDVVAKLSDLRGAVVQLRKSVWTSVVLGILLLYATLFTIVHQASRDLERQQAELRKALIGTVRSLANAVDARDLATGNHSARVAEYAEAIARAMHLSERDIHAAQSAGFLHDLGKIGIPDAILSKRGPLTKEEQRAIQCHSIGGYEILAPVPIPEPVKFAVRHSHERWDGTGYPDGLAGERIPILARIVAVADTYEALTTARPYRGACTPQEAVEEIHRGIGTQFDPRVVETLLSVWAEWTKPLGQEPTSTMVQVPTRLTSG